MSRRSKRLQEKTTTRDADEGKTDNRRLSAGGVLGLHAPAMTPNLRTAQAMSAAEAAAATLDSYNASEHIEGENTNDEIDEKNADEARADAIAAVIAPSEGREMRRRSIALMSQTAKLMASGKKDGAAEATTQHGVVEQFGILVQ